MTEQERKTKIENIREKLQKLNREQIEQVKAFILKLEQEQKK